MLLVNWKELNERTPTGSTSTWSPSRLGDARCEGCQGKDGPCNGYLCDGCGRCEWNCLCEEHDGQFSDRGKRIIPAQRYEWRSGLSDTVWCHQCETHYFLSDLVSERLLGRDELVCPRCMDEPFGIGVWEMSTSSGELCEACLRRAAILQDSKYPGCYDDCPHAGT